MVTATKTQPAYSLLGLEKDATVNAVAAVFTGPFATLKPRYLERSVDSLVVTFASQNVPYGDGEKIYQRIAKLGDGLTLDGLRDFKIFGALWLRDYDRTLDMMTTPRSVRMQETHAITINAVDNDYVQSLNRPSAQTFLMARAIINQGGFFTLAAQLNHMPERGGVTTDLAQLSPQP